MDKLLRVFIWDDDSPKPLSQIVQKVLDKETEFLKKAYTIIKEKAKADELK